MPLCDESLLERLHTCQRRGLPGLPRDELLGYMDEAAGAIDFLNEPRHPSDDGGLVGAQHRDIKPQNRVVERHPARFWAYWKSLDFRTNRAQENLFQDPLSEFRGRHTYLSCSFKGTELGGSLGSGERSARLDAVGVNAIWTPLTPRSITPTKGAQQSTSAGDTLEHLSRRQRPTAAGIEATLNRREEESHRTPGERR